MSMKKIGLFLLCLGLQSCYQSEKNCSLFRTGKFQFDYKINGKTQTTIFERNDSIEIETFNHKTDTSTIRWVNDCEYILQKKHPKNNTEAKAVVIKIISTTKNSYTFEFGYLQENQRNKGTAILLKKTNN
jgi:acetone carboxylase gamma subunit